MRAAACFLAALVLVATACTFERRSPDGEDAGSAGPPRLGTVRTPDPAARSREAPAEARAALVAFQEARRTGDRAAVRARLADDAVILRDGRALEWRDGGPAVDTLLGPTASPWDREDRTGGRILGDDVLFVLEYPSEGPDAPSFLETLLLTPGAGGWRVRLFHRFTIP